MSENAQEQSIQAENLKTTWHTDDFIHQMEKAVRYHPISHNQLLDLIELEGNIPETADRILKETLLDPLRRERGIGAKIDTEGKMIMGHIEEVGEETQVGIKYDFRPIVADDPRYQKREYPVFDIHTHGVLDLPVSNYDIARLMRNADQSPQSSMVLTETTKMLFIRTLQTPEITSEAEMKEIIKKTNLIVNIENIPSAKLGGSKWVSMIDELQIEGVKKTNIVLDMCRDYKIGVYVSYDGHHYSRINL